MDGDDARMSLFAQLALSTLITAITISLHLIGLGVLIYVMFFKDKRR